MMKITKNRISALMLLLVALCMLCTSVGCGGIDVDTQLPSESGNSETDEISSIEEINSLREDYGLGSCKSLCGEVAVILFYVDDFESSWTVEQRRSFTEEEILPGLEFLEKEAEKHGVELSLKLKKTYSARYRDDVVIDVKDSGLATIDVLTQSAGSIGFESDEYMLGYFRSIYHSEDVICLTVFNKNGTSYAINPKRDADVVVEEHCIIFARDKNSQGDARGSQASIVAHEILHLFGAEDMYAIPSRKKLAQRLYASDIMLGASYNIATNNIGEATAFYIGWTDRVPSVLYNKGWN